MTDEIVLSPSAYLEVDSRGMWTTKDVRDFVIDVGKLGVKVKIAAPSDQFKPESRYDSLISDLEGFSFVEIAQDMSLPGPPLRRAIRYFMAFFRILIRVPREPLWYVFLPAHMGVLACLARCLTRGPFGLYVRGEWPKTGIVGKLHRLFFRKARFIVATGSAFAETLRQYNDQVVEVSPMMMFTGADLNEKRTYSLNNEAQVLFVGALTARKGVLELVKATRIVMQRFPFRLRLVGTAGSEDMEQLQEEIRSSGCSENIELLGYVGGKERLTELFESADIFVLPTWNPEGFPRVIYEAMSFGVPVISTDFEGGRLFLRDRENCRIIQKKDVEGLADCLLDLLQNESQRSKLGKAAWKDVKELHQRFEGITHGQQVVELLRATQKTA